MSLKRNDPVVEKVGGRKYYIRPFGAFKAARLSGDLASTLAPAIGALVPIFNSGNQGDKDEDYNFDIGNVDADAVASAISNCSAIDGEKLESLAKKLLLGGHIATEIEDEDGNLEATRLDEDLADELFCGDVQDMFILCFHVIKLNFNGFFKNLAAQSGKEESAAPKKPRPIL